MDSTPSFNNIGEKWFDMSSIKKATKLVLVFYILEPYTNYLFSLYFVKNYII